jgi:hypothetical protein
MKNGDTRAKRRVERALTFEIFQSLEHGDFLRKISLILWVTPRNKIDHLILPIEKAPRRQVYHPEAQEGRWLRPSFIFHPNLKVLAIYAPPGDTSGKKSLSRIPYHISIDYLKAGDLVEEQAV